MNLICLVPQYVSGWGSEAQSPHHVHPGSSLWESKPELYALNENQYLFSCCSSTGYSHSHKPSVKAHIPAFLCWESQLRAQALTVSRESHPRVGSPPHISSLQHQCWPRSSATLILIMIFVLSLPFAGAGAISCYWFVQFPSSMAHMVCGSLGMGFIFCICDKMFSVKSLIF